MRREFSDAIEKIALEDEKVVFITGDLGYNALENLQAAMGNRFINAGVAEQKLMPLFVEFGTWIAENYRPTVAMQELRYWQKGSYQNKDYFYSTEELLEQFIEQRNK